MKSVSILLVLLFFTLPAVGADEIPLVGTFVYDETSTLAWYEKNVEDDEVRPINEGKRYVFSEDGHDLAIWHKYKMTSTLIEWTKIKPGKYQGGSPKLKITILDADHFYLEEEYSGETFRCYYKRPKAEKTD